MWYTLYISVNGNGNDSRGALPDDASGGGVPVGGVVDGPPAEVVGFLVSQVVPAVCSVVYSDRVCSRLLFFGEKSLKCLVCCRA